MRRVSAAPMTKRFVRDLGYLEEHAHGQLDGQINEVKRMLHAFIQRLSKAQS